MYTVYILKSAKTGKRYIGYTKNLAQRLKIHDIGKTKSLKGKGPFEVIYTEKISNRQDAYKREKQIKSYKGGQALKKLISTWKNQ